MIVPRRNGKTTNAMLAAPRNGYYVVYSASSIPYMRALALSLNRDDLCIVACSWLNARNIMTHENIDVVIDHATMLDTQGYQALQRIEERKRK